MYYCLLNQGRTDIVWHIEDLDDKLDGAEYAFKLSSAFMESEASAVAKEIRRIFVPEDNRERNISRIERFLGELDFLDRRFPIVWQANFDDFREFFESYVRSKDPDGERLLEVAAECGGVPCENARFFESHAADFLVEASIADEKDLKRFFPDDDDSSFAADARWFFKRTQDLKKVYERLN